MIVWLCFRTDQILVFFFFFFLLANELCNSDVELLTGMAPSGSGVPARKPAQSVETGNLNVMLGYCSKLFPVYSDSIQHPCSLEAP